MISSVEFDGPGLPLRFIESSFPYLGAGEALVRVRLCTLCGSDLHTYFGRRSTPLPTVLGHEIVGDIVETHGAKDLAGTLLKPGDRVVWSVACSCRRCFYCEHELPQKCDHLRKYGHLKADPDRGPSGGLTTHCHLLANTAIIRVPDSIPDAVAAPAMCATATVAAASRAAPVGDSETIVIFGAGLLGLTAAALSLAKNRIVVDPQPARLELAKAFGATHALTPAELPDCVRSLTAGRGADAVLEISGVPVAVEQAIDSARIGGTVVLVGSVFSTRPIPMLAEDFVRRCLTIRGVHNYAPIDLLTAIEFLGEGGRRFPFADQVVSTFPLAEVADAFAFAEAEKPIRVGIKP